MRGVREGIRDSDMSSRKWYLGIDEAGRGCAIGPLVVCGFAMAEEELPMLLALPLADSKALSPAERERLAPVLRGLPARIRMARFSPPSIDAAVAHNGLNGLEISAMVRMLRTLKPSTAFSGP